MPARSCRHWWIPAVSAEAEGCTEVLTLLRLAARGSQQERPLWSHCFVAGVGTALGSFCGPALFSGPLTNRLCLHSGEV